MQNRWVSLSLSFFLGLGLHLPVLADPASDIDGNWQGSGTVLMGFPLDTEIAKVTVTIATESDQLLIDECWQLFSGQEPTCLETNLQIVAGSQLFSGSTKVGDIFPGRILIFSGNAQVSEQILIRRIDSERLLYRYIYSNIDGEGDVREATLSRALSN